MKPTRDARLIIAAAALALFACGPAPLEADEAEPEWNYTSAEQGLVSCSTRTDTGYRNGAAFTITVVTADGKPVELDTANAYAVMQAEAARAGVNLVVVSGFRTMAEQQYLYGCYVNCNCNSCNLAARPGYSNHQSGHALDLNTSAPGVYNWLAANAGRFGFSRTVPSEPWHWEWWGGGPGGGPCGNTPDNCTRAEADGCGNFGCGCVDHQCNGVFCPGTGCSAQHAAACGAFGCGCADGQCNGGTCPGSGCTAKETLDCAKFGCGCVDHQCNGGFCPGTGCTWREAHDCAAFGVNCVDHQCAGGFGPGTGCTARETNECRAKGCNCVDHQCSGGDSCDGSGSTARNVLDCGAFGCHSVDGKCSGGFCPGTGCTGKQTADCARVGCGCVDEKCSGGFCPGTGCTARQTLDCQGVDAGCSMGRCVSAAGEPVATPDAGEPQPAPDDGGFSMTFVDAGPAPEPEPQETDPNLAPPEVTSIAPEGGGTVMGGCAAVPDFQLVALLALVALPLGSRRRSSWSG
ncbi:MAG: M15 family metallopeptidase [Myxococcota bacterium]